MPSVTNPIVETYSRLAKQYDDESNTRSCWGHATEEALASICLRDEYEVVLDMGCGTGQALTRLSAAAPRVQFFGVDPAENMRTIAVERAHGRPNIKILDGCFEKIPLESESVDYLYSLFAFHWTTDLGVAVTELARVLKPNAEMDLFFIGRNNGREFIRKTTPIFLKYMGPALLLQSAQMRTQLTKEAAFDLFAKHFPAPRLSVEEAYRTYFDTVEGHWGWWVRIEGHFVRIPPEKKQACDSEVRRALLSLEGDQGISYTIHELHVRLRRV